MRAIQNLLPLLKASPSPRVVSVLAGGLEGKLVEDDLDLLKPKNYSIINAAVHSATMGTLVLGRFAAQNPEISFVHAYPGSVATTTFSKGSTGIVKLLLSWVIQPIINTFFATSVDDAGARALFYLTSARYAVVPNTGTPLPTGVEPAVAAYKRLFLADANSEDTGNKALLSDFDVRGVSDKVWEFTQDIFQGAVSAR
jgi:hypothetical protein